MHNPPAFAWTAIPSLSQPCCCHLVLMPGEDATWNATLFKQETDMPGDLQTLMTTLQSDISDMEWLVW